MTKFNGLITKLRIKSRVKLISASLLVLSILVLGGYALSFYNDWSQENKLIFRSPIVLAGTDTYVTNWIEITAVSKHESTDFFALGQE